MNVVELVNQKMTFLPPNIQEQVLDYVDYLTTKYKMESDEETLERFLLLRAKESDENPKSKVSFEELDKRIFSKYPQNEV